MRHGLLIGYARWTTDAQDLAAQREALTALGVSTKRGGRSTALGEHDAPEPNDHPR